MSREVFLLNFRRKMLKLQEHRFEKSPLSRSKFLGDNVWGNLKIAFDENSLRSTTYSQSSIPPLPPNSSVSRSVCRTHCGQQELELSTAPEALTTQLLNALIGTTAANGDSMPETQSTELRAQVPNGWEPYEVLICDDRLNDFNRKTRGGADRQDWNHRRFESDQGNGGERREN